MHICTSSCGFSLSKYLFHRGKSSIKEEMKPSYAGSVDMNPVHRKERELCMYIYIYIRTRDLYRTSEAVKKKEPERYIYREVYLFPSMFCRLSS
jgi:hypothetical protein